MNQLTSYFNEKERKEFIKICKFISSCSIDQAASIVNEVLMLHPILCFNVNTKSLDGVESVSVNGDAIQLNLEQHNV